MAQVFRTGELNDVPAVVALVQSAYRGESSRAGWTSEEHLLDGQRIDAAMLTDSIADPESRVLVLEERGVLVACCELRRPAIEFVAGFGMFAVTPNRQRGGIGRRVLAEAERIASKEWGANRLRLTVIGQRSELIAWYERCGYAPTGEYQSFPYGDDRYGFPRRDDLRLAVLEKHL